MMFRAARLMPGPGRLGRWIAGSDGRPTQATIRPDIFGKISVFIGRVAGSDDDPTRYI